MILGRNPSNGGIPAMDRIASDAGMIDNKGKDFICLILLIVSL